MVKRYYMSALLLALPLAVAPACSEKAEDRAALEQDEMDRELDMALQGDTAPATFQDTAQGVAEQPEPESPPQPSPSPQRAERSRTPSPAPRPAPRRDEPDPEPVRREPRVSVATASIGTTFAVTLNETLSTESNRVGDGFTATLSSPILGGNGEVVVPAGATVRGRLTQVNKSGHVGETGVISVAFESVSFDGRSLPLDGSVVKANPQRKNRTPAKEQVAKAAGGAVAGAVLGRVLGKNTKSTITGAVVGAAAGTAIAMGTADVDVVLPAGSEMVIKLDSPLEVRRTT